MNITNLAKQHNIPRTTLSRRLRAGQSIEEATKKRELHPRVVAFNNWQIIFQHTPCKKCGETNYYVSSGDCINRPFHNKEVKAK